MKFKRILSIFLTLFCFLGVSASVFASEDRYTWADGWDVGTFAYTTVKGVQAEVSGDVVHGGKYAMKVWNKAESNTRIWTRLRGLETGETYTVNAYVRIVGPSPVNTMLRITPEYKSSAGAALGTSQTVSSTTGRFVKLSAAFTMPEDLPSVTVCLDTGAISDGCTVYWDDVSVDGIELDINGGFETITRVQPEEIIVPDQFQAVDYAINGSFEDNNGLSPTKWNAYQGWSKDNPYVSLTNEKAHTGTTAVKIQSDVTGKNPWASQVVAVKPGTEYVASAWIYSDHLEGDASIVFKFEFYTSPDDVSGKTHLDGDSLSDDFYTTDGKWVKMQGRFYTGLNCHGAAIYPRLYGIGTVYVDDFEVHQLTEPTKMSLSTDWCFYREYHESGVATVMPTDPAFSYTDTSVSFAFKDGESVVLSQEKKPMTEAGVQFTYPTSLIKEKGKPYIIVATLYNADGTEAEVQTTPVYRIDTSPYLREDGVYLLEKKTPFYPVIGYHVSLSETGIPPLKEAGINTVQVMATRMSELDGLMERVEESGLMALVGLYFGMKPPAHPDNQEFARDVVEKYKDHPNVLGWMIMDEPFLHMQYNVMVGYLRDSYALVRKYDPEHPVYLLDNYADTFKETAKYADILASDPYPVSREDPATYISDRMGQLRIATRGEKARCAILQTYDYGPSWWPNASQYRSSIYQAFFEGATAMGYFAISDSQKQADGTILPLYETDLWPAVVEYKNVDMEMAHKVFVSGEIPTFNDVRTEDYWYRSWEKDGKLYLILLNRDNNNAKEAEIRLTSFDGNVTVGDFSAKIISGGSGTYSGNGTLKVEMEPCAAQLWEITPQEPIDTSGASRFTYYDMNTYGWARKAAETLKEKGITEDADVFSFRPGEKITRAEFAGFLIRTLGLTSNTAENFADVSAETPYAAEIAIGRDLGILKGTDGVNYNPDAEISRQDLMVICARGMRAVKALEEGGALDFSDKEAIADYAVLDIAAAVRAGIVRGNADGTLNPLGNTTRAEAAVIMDRIATWSAEP